MPLLTCADVLDSLRDAVRDYDVKEVCQTDLKPLSVMLLSELYAKCYGKRYKYAYLHVNNMNTDKYRKWVLQWVKREFHLNIEDYECVVDLNIMHGIRDPYKVLITAESEAYSPEAAALSKGEDDEENDMLRDLYKLLHYPSPLRLFITLSSDENHNSLLRKTSQKIAAYADILASCDIFAVQVPTGKLSSHTCTIAHWKRKDHKKKAQTLMERLL